MFLSPIAGDTGRSFSKIAKKSAKGLSGLETYPNNLLAEGTEVGIRMPWVKNNRKINSQGETYWVIKSNCLFHL